MGIPSHKYQRSIDQEEVGGGGGGGGDKKQRANNASEPEQCIQNRQLSQTVFVEETEFNE